MTSSQSPLTWLGRVQASPLAAVLILAVAALSFTIMMTGLHRLALVALALVLVYIVLGWPKLRRNTRALLVASLIATVAYIGIGGDLDAFALAASHAMYLPALIAVMTLLRIAAQRSTMISRAGYYVVSQPPSRRFALLASAGHLFGILLNVGGLLLLLNIAHGTRDRSVEPRVAAIQERRITNAILRGFAATMMWSPFGIALNILIPILPGISWFDYMPYGLAATLAFCVLGWVFDRIEPRSGAPVPAGRNLGSVWALLGLVGLLVTITGTAAVAEEAFGMPLRAAILLVVPGFAIAWTMLTRQPGESAGDAIGWLAGESATQLPNAVNEITIMTSSGYLGMVIATLVPPDQLQALIAWAGLHGGGLAVAIGLTILGASFVGINPMIPGTILVGSAISADVPISDTLLLLSVLTAWAAALVVSPMTSTITIASTVLGKPPSLIGVKWNGAFTITFFVAVSAFFLLFG
ncbi:hypothetical protein [Amorphus coralli]|uniref:hypothetical protein n=1 Tax=Amorphus coralli TaxID=340680 RepID=UPI0012ECA9F4|nr:hypothetical protein [Amorphus coralli]